MPTPPAAPTVAEFIASPAQSPMVLGMWLIRSISQTYQKSAPWFHLLSSSSGSRALIFSHLSPGDERALGCCWYTPTPRPSMEAPLHLHRELNS